MKKFSALLLMILMVGCGQSGSPGGEPNKKSSLSGSEVSSLLEEMRLPSDEDKAAQDLIQQMVSYAVENGITKINEEDLASHLSNYKLSCDEHNCVLTRGN